MGRKPKDTQETTEVNTSAQVDVKAFLKKSSIKGMVSTLKTSLLSNIDEWIPTGSLTLNKIVSGDLKKGYPRGRIMALAGPSGVGKTYLCGNAAREAQKLGYTVTIFDSENAIDDETFGRLGVDTEQVIHIPVITVNEFRNKCIKFMDEFMEANPNAKLFIIVDSIGGLTTQKVLDDIEEDKGVSDMGLRAKQLRETAKVLTSSVAKHKACMICTNHTYEQPPPNPNMAPIVKFGGGEGFVYATSGIIFLRKKAIREEETTATGDTVKRKKGNILIATTEKNRFVPEGMSGEIYLSFEKGLNKYYGLLEDAMEFKLIEEGSPGWVSFKGTEEKVRKKEMYNPVYWKPIIDELVERIREKYKFNTTVSEDEIDQIDIKDD